MQKYQQQKKWDLPELEKGLNKGRTIRLSGGAGSFSKKKKKTWLAMWEKKNNSPHSEQRKKNLTHSMKNKKTNFARKYYSEHIEIRQKMA